MGSRNGAVAVKERPPKLDAEGRIPCQEPGCDARIKPAGMQVHIRRKHSPHLPQWSTMEQTGDFPCGECSRVLKSSSALAKHRNRTHGNPSSLDADALFERLGTVTKALFPDGVPNSRIIEVAEWQKVTLQLMRRG